MTFQPGAFTGTAAVVEAETMRKTDGVLIAGGGPVGMTAALALARRGVPVTLLEAQPQVSTESRASTFHPPTLEMLDDLGVAEELVGIGVRSARFQYRDRETGVVGEFDLGLLSDETRFPFRLQCEQSVLTPIELRHLEQSDCAEVLFDHRVVGAVPAPDGPVVVDVETPDGPVKFSAPWVIGCDGAHSAVRGSLGLEFSGLTYPDRYLVISTELDLREVLPDIAYVNYVSDPREWFVLLRTHKEWRALFPVGLDEPDEELTDPAFVENLMQKIAPRSEGYPISHVTLYKVHQRVAESFRIGRIMLAGDAAHINNPLGGMGMNSGIHDAYLLAGSLADVYLGQSDESVLDRWAEQRRRVCVEHVQKTSDRNYAEMREQDPVERAKYLAQLRATANDPQLAHAYLMNSSMLSSFREPAGR